MLAPMIPDNAPFSPEQRTWLNGFFAGLLSLDGSPALDAVPPPRAIVPAIGASSTAGADPLADGDDGEAPWHDPTILLPDFFYEDEFTAMRTKGTLTRLSRAFSRDQAEKIYVQDRMREEGDELFRWLEEGAHLFVCGDAKRMAPDVERTLVEIVARHGCKGETEARAYVAALGRAGRYQKDVY